jgi:hypothetical protein
VIAQIDQTTAPDQNTDETNLMATTLDSMAYLKNNDGNARSYYLRSAVDQYLFTYSIFSFGSTVFIINTYIPLMDRINSMVMVEKLKSTLVEELKRTLTQQ